MKADDAFPALDNQYDDDLSDRPEGEIGEQNDDSKWKIQI